MVVGPPSSSDLDTCPSFAASASRPCARRTKEGADGKGIPDLSVGIPEGNFSRGERLSEERHGRNGRGRHHSPASSYLSPGRSPSEAAARTRACPPRATPRGSPGSPPAGRSRARLLGSPVSSQLLESRRARRARSSPAASDSSAGTSSGSNGSGSKPGGASVDVGRLAVRVRLGGLELVGAGAVVRERARSAGRRPQPARARPSPAAEGLLLLALDLVVGGPRWRFSSRCSRMASSRLPMDGYH